MSVDISARPNVDAWPGVELGQPMAGGARNPVYRARQGGEELVVRVSARPAASLDWELDLLEVLCGAGVRVPVPVLTEDGRRHTDGILVHRFIPGRPPADHQDWCRVVDVLQEIHETLVGWPQRPGSPPHGSC